MRLAGRTGPPQGLPPKSINYVTWRKEANAHTGRLEVALFERPFRADHSRLLREVVEDLAGGNGHGASGGQKPGQKGRVWPGRASG
jgi:hypothetical protein